MATQNIAVPTSEGAGLILSLADHIFEAHGPEIGDAAINKNFALAYMKSKAETPTSGGLDFAQPVLKSENSNFGHRSHYADIPASIQDPTRSFRFDPITLDGTVAINQKHVAMNQGKAQIKKLMKTLKMQAQTTIENTVNSALWASSPTANVEPESIPSIVSTTPTTGSLGGITRSGNTFAQNKTYTTAITSIGSSAGLAVLHKFRMTLGGAAKDTPDFAVTTATIAGLLYGYLDSLRRLKTDEQMTKLGFGDSFYIGTALLGYDGDGGTGECPDKAMYYLNSKHLFFQILEGGNFVFEKFSRKGNNLNSTSIFYLFYNLTTNLPSSMGVLSNITG